MVLEKSELPSCSTVQSCHPKWVPEDPIYKIGPPPSCAPLATQRLALSTHQGVSSSLARPLVL